MSFYVNEFEVGVDDGIFSGNEQQKVYVNVANLTYFIKVKSKFTDKQFQSVSFVTHRDVSWVNTFKSVGILIFFWKKPD